jgi:acetyl esterase/lipase
VPAGALRIVLEPLAGWVFSADASWTARRRRFKLITRALRTPPGTTVTHERVGGVPVERVSGRDAHLATILLYLHGGGYAVGSPRTHRALAARLAAEMLAVAIVPAYRLAPEHPHPAALEDALAVYEALLATGYEPDRIVFAGDSAGGALALALAIDARTRNLPLPAAIALICPWLDVAAARLPSPREPALTQRLLAEFADAYAPAGSRRDPAVSPIHADLRGLPPLLIESASVDPVAADAQILADRARAAGVDFDHRHHDGLWHAFHLLTSLLAPADAATAALGRALRTTLNGRGPALAANQVSMYPSRGRDVRNDQLIARSDHSRRDR